MSSYHVLTRRDHPQQGDKVTIVLHLTTPTGNNDAGIPWSEALVDSGLASSALPDGPLDEYGQQLLRGRITDAEEHAILSGAIYSATVEKDVPQGATLQDIQALGAAEVALAASHLDNMQTQLRFFGAEG